MDTYRLLINGELVDSDRWLEVINPATEERLALCPRASERQADMAVKSAKAAFDTWSQTPLGERRALLVKLADALQKEAPALARLLTQEQGKPLAEATAELAYTEAFIRYFAAMELPVKVIEENEGRRVELHRKPLGVVAAIVPWNFPLLIVSFKLPPALLAGNTIILKPAPTTPLATLKLGELCKEIFPPGVVNVITDDNDLGPVLTRHPLVRKVTMTGSTETGRKVMATAAETLKRITLELGGNDAGIVLDDANPKEVASKIFAGAFVNSGQVCIALKRLYVHEKIYDALCDELAEIAKNTIVDDGMKQGTQMGPLQNKKQFEKAKAYLVDARISGRVIAGGEIVNRPGYFVLPTIVRDIKDGAKLVDEEQFAPILPVIKFSDQNDAVSRANASPYGLGASVWSSNPERAYEVASRLEAGTVWINKHFDIGPNIPFAGAKQSGLGVEFAEEGLAEYTQMKVVNIAR